MAVNDKASLNPLQLTGKNILEYILSLCAREAAADDLIITRDIKEIFVLSNLLRFYFL
jgi:hypothetical protein